MDYSMGPYPFLEQMVYIRPPKHAKGCIVAYTCRTSICLILFEFSKKKAKFNDKILFTNVMHLLLPTDRWIGVYPLLHIVFHK